MTQLRGARVPDAMVDDVDELVADGVVANRSEAVRVGVEQLVDRHRRSKVGREIADAYRRLPQSDDESGWTDAAAAAMIAEEPW